MYKNSKKLSAAHKRMREQLEAMGWTEFPDRFHRHHTEASVRPYDSPSIEGIWLENRLKEINTGEAYYALEMYGLRLEHLAWRCNSKNPNVDEPLDTLDAFDYAREMMLDGIRFDYTHGEGDPERRPEEYSGVIRVIDWEKPESNSFEFADGHVGAMEDGFMWDFVLYVNAIPVGAILLEADEKESDALPCQKALDTAQYQLDNDFQFPVYLHNLIISNGKQVMEANPWYELDEFRKVESVEEVLNPTEWLEKKVKNPE